MTIDVNLSGGVCPTYHDVIILKDINDLLNYQEIQDNRVRGDFKKFLTSKSRDHESYGAELSSMFIPVTYDDALNFLSRLDRKVRDSMLAKLSALQAGNHVVVNQRGGWFHAKQGDYTIVSSTPDHFMQNVRIVPGTTTIVLENDPLLDPFFIRDGLVVSSVLNLRTLTSAQVEQALNAFHDRGGKEVLVYTQANQLDEVQAYLTGYRNSRMSVLRVVMAGPMDERVEAVALFKKYGAYVMEITE